MTIIEILQKFKTKLTEAIPLLKGTGNFSVVQNDNNIASNDHSTALGYKTTASGYAAIAMGDSTKAVGTTAHTEGKYTIAEGEYAHAEGYKAHANGNASHAEGYETEATGKFGHAGGKGCTATGEASFAHGTGTTAQNANEVALGSYNAQDAKSVFCIGGGASKSDRKNLLQINKDGEVLLVIEGSLSSLQALLQQLGNKNTIPADVSRSNVDASFVNSDKNHLFYLRCANANLAGLMTAEDYTLLHKLGEKFADELE